MKTKDVILVVAGVAVGYLLLGFLNKPKDNAQTTGSNPTVDQSKIDLCNEQANKSMSKIEFAVGTDLVAYKKQLIDACMKDTGIR
jgi:hypothetical protein